MDHLAALNRAGTIRMQNGKHKDQLGRRGTFRKVSRMTDEETPEQADVHKTELPRHEVDCVKMNFGFYDKKGTGHVELFELPMLLDCCGYHLTDQQMHVAQEYIKKRKLEHIDVTRFISLLCHLRDLELEQEQK